MNAFTFKLYLQATAAVERPMLPSNSLSLITKPWLARRVDWCIFISLQWVEALWTIYARPSLWSCVALQTGNKNKQLKQSAGPPTAPAICR